MSGDPIITVLGLGEAGGAFARDLVDAARASSATTPPSRAGRCRAAASEAEAVAGAALVLSVNSAHDAVDAFRNGAEGLGEAADGVVWADLNTGLPSLKRELDGLAGARGVRFADVAIMAPVPGRGLRTPLLASGGAAADVARVPDVLGASVEVLPGEAARRRAASCCAASSSRAWRPRSSRRWRRRGPPGARTGCATTSSTSWSARASRPSTGW
ncbi:NAD(P)-binding domain-containing protein [Actinomadura sp. CNU-125]|uniref:NAD(P)-binding domain-containing protein n=1 Tax=Actinomadura sp. CNU-125 TaxID=1904961 RepID=UPI0021CD0C2E|nr:NAD(P)-binding domain-containing protein [Actinomadura sp. CNU-125]